MSEAEAPIRVGVSGWDGRVAGVLGLMAGVLYNSWPLGFVLDPGALGGTYISVLEVPGRPHAHVFVACDLAAGALAVLAGLLKRRHPPVAAGLVMFGIGNMLEATIPIEASCTHSVASCGIGPGQLLAPHDLAGIVSAAGLVLALWSLRGHSRWMRAVIALGVVTGLFLGVSLLVDRWVTVSQISFLVGCGVALSAVPLARTDRRPLPSAPLPLVRRGPPIHPAEGRVR
jgi:hypothetical protein